MLNILRKYWLFITVLFILSLFLRFYKLEDWFYFNIDEDWFNYIVRKIVVYKRPVLIGWEMPGGILTAPVTYYLGAFLMIIFNNNLLGYAIFASLISSITVVLVFIVAIDLFKSKTIAMFSSLIFCVSYLVIIYSRVTLTLYFGPLLAVITYLSLKKVIIDNEKKWLYALSIVGIFSTQEGSLISLLILILISLKLFAKNLKLTDIIGPISIFCIILIPIIAFDLRNDFLAAKRIISLFSIEKNASLESKFNTSLADSTLLFFESAGRIFIPTGSSDINVQVLPCEKYLSVIKNNTTDFFYIFPAILIIGFIIYSFKKLNTSIKLISVHLVIGLVGVLFFSIIVPGHLHRWFFVVYFPAFCLIGSFYLTLLTKYPVGKSLSLALLSSYVLFNTYKVVTGTSSVGFKDKSDAVKYVITEMNDKSYSLDIVGSGCNGYGYRFLFSHYGSEPSISYMDQQYNGWLYTNSFNGEIAYKVYIVPLIDLDTQEMNNKYLDIKKNSSVSKRINNLEILIVKNL